MKSDLIFFLIEGISTSNVLVAFDPFFKVGQSQYTKINEFFFLLFLL